MPASDDTRNPDERAEQASAKRPYVTPKLETLGTIRELTRGAGQMNMVDGGHPPGLNKSSV